MTQNKWAEIIPLVEKWLNSSVSETIGHSLVEIVFNEPKPDAFKQILHNTQDKMPPVESLENKVLHAYARMQLTEKEREQVPTNGIPIFKTKCLYLMQHWASCPCKGPYIIIQELYQYLHMKSLILKDS
jgi:hypothetical protein